MSFQESVASALFDAGVNVHPDVIADRDSVMADIDSLVAWLDSLEGDTRMAVDEVTASNPVQQHLAHPEVGLAPAIGPVLEAFDNQPSSISISAAVDMIAAAVRQADA